MKNLEDLQREIRDELRDKRSIYGFPINISFTTMKEITFRKEKENKKEKDNKNENENKEEIKGKQRAFSTVPYKHRKKLA